MRRADGEIATSRLLRILRAKWFFRQINSCLTRVSLEVHRPALQRGDADRLDRVVSLRPREAGVRSRGSGRLRQPSHRRGVEPARVARTPGSLNSEHERALGL